MLIELAATIRKACSYPAARDSLQIRTEGMAELISSLTGRLYSEVLQEIVTRCDNDTRTVLDASRALAYREETDNA